MSLLRCTYRPLLLSLVAALPALTGCADTIVFGAQREIDVAIALNEDVAEPIQVNIGLNSQIAALIPPIGENDQASASNVATASTLEPALQHFNPEGEAASIFSGFRYTSSSMLTPTGTALPKYDAEIRSQFASGAAAVLLAESQEAVGQVVDVAITFDRAPDFMSPAIATWRDRLGDRVEELTEAKISLLYFTPPTTEPKVEALVAMHKGDRPAECDASDRCRRDVVSIRVENLATPADLQKWDEAFSN